MRRKVIVRVMNKNIYIENPDNINIDMRKGKRHYNFNLKVDEPNLINLAKTFKTISKRVKA